jgi:heme iron utilization protein
MALRCVLCSIFCQTQRRDRPPARGSPRFGATSSIGGPVTFIVHTDDGVFETKASLPPGNEARGYFNIHGESPLGGHLRIARCAAIYFVDRPFFGRRSCSLQFINLDGGAMFKVFVGRDETRELLADQLARFERLRDAETTAA